MESNYHLDIYEYEDAIEYENRSFFRILYIVMLSKDNNLNTFFLKFPLELQPLSICLLLFSYTSDLALNTLFYLVIIYRINIFIKEITYFCALYLIIY